MAASYPEARARAQYLSVHENADIRAGFLCQKVSRTIVDVPAFGGTALIAFDNIPEKFKVFGKKIDGALLYYDDPKRKGEAGHVTWSIKAYEWSVDVVKWGDLDLVPWGTIENAWGMRFLGSAIGTPYGPLNLAPRPLPSPVPHLLPVVYMSELKDGKYSESAALVNEALVELGFLKPALRRGYWSDAAQAAFRAFRASQGLSPTSNGTAFIRLGQKSGNFTVRASR